MTLANYSVAVLFGLVFALSPCNFVHAQMTRHPVIDLPIGYSRQALPEGSQAT